jgi:peptidoglycan/LPS O-acetylase OafA/YrhL
MAGLSHRFGFISYPVYALHWPLGLMVAALARHGFGATSDDWPILAPLVHLSVVIGVAWLVARWFDTPVRARLKRRYSLSADAPAQTAP